MAAPSKSIEASNTTAPASAGRGKALNLTYAPSNDRALRAIADELRRIGDALSRTANHVSGADVEAADAAKAEGTDAEPAPVVSPQDEALFQSLREWRAGEARKLGMPPYIVATDKALRALVERRPTKIEDLQGVPGFGPAKAAKYGPNVVELVASA
jgi:superfamily II DNA helicase RecQ